LKLIFMDPSGLVQESPTRMLASGKYAADSGFEAARLFSLDPHTVRRDEP
jgi:hypothetical protein